MNILESIENAVVNSDLAYDQIVYLASVAGTNISSQIASSKSSTEIHRKTDTVLR